MRTFLVSLSTVVFGLSCLGQSLSEDFEGFELGQVNNQAGWRSGIGTEIVETNISSFGTRSVRTDADGGWIQSPLVGNGFATFSFDLLFEEASSGGNFSIQTYNSDLRPSQSLTFLPDGQLALETSVGTCLTNGRLIDGTWTRGQVHRLEWSMLPSASVVPAQTIRLDGEVIFEGSNSLGCGRRNGVNTVGIFAGRDSSGTSLIVDNFQFDSLGPRADFDADGDLDVTDIDTLTAAIAIIGFYDQRYDLNLDGLVDLADRDEWLAIAGAANLGVSSYRLGDANLDGLVDVTDYNIWNANKFSYRGQWSSGDFNASGPVDVGDFNIWNANKFLAAASLQPIPEPSSVMMLVVGGLLLVHLPSRSRMRCLGR